MIEGVKGASEAPSTAPAQSTAVSSVSGGTSSSAAGFDTATAAASMLALRPAGDGETVSNGASSRTDFTRITRSVQLEDVVVRNLLDSLSSDTKIAGSFILAEGQETSGQSLFAAYYQDV